MSLLELSGITHAYGDHKVVRSLSMDLDTGAIGCLLGPSGCGKTTVLRCIAGFERLTSGSIRLAGELVSGPGVHVVTEDRRIGMVFQDYALFPHLNVAENVGFGLRGDRALRDARVDELLETIGLSGAGSRFPHELSGGQQQRIALARALAPKPRLLLLDEPFSNLDVDLRERLAIEVRAVLKTEGITAVLVTHDQHEAFAFADEIGVMQDGVVQQWDTPYNLYHCPRNRFIADFVGQGVFLPGVVIDRAHVQIELGTLQGSLSPQDAGDGDAGVQAGNVAGAGGDADPGVGAAAVSSAPARKFGASVLLRPDDIVHDDSSEMKAEVVAKAFRGAEFLYTLRLPSGARVLSLVPSHHNHAIGEMIGIRLDVDHVVAFREQP